MKTYENLIALSALRYREAAVQMEYGNIWEADRLVESGITYKDAIIALEGGEKEKAKELETIAYLTYRLAFDNDLEHNDRVNLEDYLELYRKKEISYNDVIEVAERL